MKTYLKNPIEGESLDSSELLQELLEQSRMQTTILSEIKIGIEMDTCLLDKIAYIVCMLVNETHKNTQSVNSIRDSLSMLLELYQSVHPEQTLQLDKINKLKICQHM